MYLPGFTAEASVYADTESIPDRSSEPRFEPRAGVGRHVHMLGPGCTSFSCPSRPDPDCEGACVGGVDTQRCCDCTGGIWDPVRHRCE